MSLEATATVRRVGYGGGCKQRLLRLQDPEEWAAEEEHEEDEEGPATEAGGSEGSNESVSADSHESFLSYRPQTGRRTTRGASGASDTIQTTATSGGSIKLLWEIPCLPGSINIVGEINSQRPLFIFMSI